MSNHPPRAAKWSGYLTTGVMDEPSLDAGLTACFDGNELPVLEVEPGRIFVVSGFARKNLEVWNQRRTRVQLSSDCRPIEYTDELPEYIQIAELNERPVRFAGGYQIDVSQGIDNNEMTIQSVLNGGELGAPPAELPMPGEEVPLDRDFLDGGLACNAVLRSINGVGGPHIVFSGGLGVLVQDHPNISRIVLNVNGESINVCPNFPEPEDVDCVPNRSDHCGLAGGGTESCPPGSPDSRAGYLAEPLIQLSQLPTEDTNTPLLYGTRQPGSCRFQRTTSGWSQLPSTVGLNYQCPAPTFAGYVGQEVVVTPRPVPADPTTIVRNAFFLDNLQYWTLDRGSVETVYSPLPGIPYANVLQTGVLMQAAVPVHSGEYVFQMRLDGNGPVLLQIISNIGSVLWQQQVNVDVAATEYISGVFSLPTLPVDIRISPATNTLKATQILLTKQ